MLSCKNSSFDQATGLHRIAHPRPVRVIAVTSGKGGVGKTNVSVNLALALAQADKQVMLLDADIGLANVDVMLGLSPQYNLSHVINGERGLEEIIVTGPSGLKVIPAASGIQSLTEIGAVGYAGLIRAFSEITHNLDVLVVDTAAGISDSVVSFTRASQEVLIVVCDEPASITDAYAMIKVLSRDHGLNNFHILANMTKGVREGQELFGKLERVTERFLDVSLDYAGSIPYDDYLRKAVQRQRAVLDIYPRSRAGVGFANLARKAESWPMPEIPSGHLEFFVERLIGANRDGERIAV